MNISKIKFNTLLFMLLAVVYSQAQMVTDAKSEVLLNALVSVNGGYEKLSSIKKM